MASIGFVDTVLMFGALLIAIGILSSLVATRFGAPLLLVFLVIGMLVGEDGPGGLAFGDYQLTYLIGSVSLAIILFDGGLRTRVRAARGAFRPAVLLATVGVLVTTGLTGLVAVYLLKLSLLQGLLVGATIASTDAAAVFFLLRAGGMQLKRRVGATLEIESGTNDPIALFLVLFLTQAVLSGDSPLSWTLLGDLATQAAIGGAIGVGGGLTIAWCLNKLDLPSGLHPPFVVTMAVLIYGVSANLHGSGFLAVYLAGLVVGNRPVRAFPAVLSFHDAATWLCQIVMFLVLGLLVSPGRLIEVLVPALGVAAFLIVFGRPLAVWLCLTPFGFSRREKLFVSWVGLRGAVSIFLAAVPTLAGVPNAAVYFNIAFVVVLVSLIVQGWTITTAARRLDIALKRPTRPVSRVELDLPGQSEQEMVGYPLLAESPAAHAAVLPAWAKLILVIRGSEILNPVEAVRIEPSDYLYFIAPTARVPELDRLFRPLGETSLREAATVSEFQLRGDVMLGALGALYDLPIAGEDAETTVTQVFARRFDDSPEQGDEIAIGEARLVARKVVESEVRVAGLRLPPDETGPVRPGTVLSRVRSRLGAYRRVASSRS
ncbi:potassium/proton antiporter [Segnochrobactrum spirostomi]|uniref:Potassium/proton antiporter n=1 Tax=Segnochrobactrum spirostomi TaxID=2608987 RepID=A0A6A7Y3N5_9HYPH|nr:potassium/proton antiporter [Segnochrobactrum spirostomi]MQT12987.1 potassium/proton antiporter [Segnochrobactrum spirostomi]